MCQGKGEGIGGTAFTAEGDQQKGLINDPASSIPLLGGSAKADAPEHFAIPPDWKWSFRTKVYIASVMVVVMTGLSIAGTALQIKQNSQLTWDCAAVSA